MLHRDWDRQVQGWPGDTPGPDHRRPIEAVFLDRDGTINKERPDYVKSLEEFDLIPGSLEAIGRLAELGVPIIVVTNQSAIGRGIVAPAVVEQIHAHLRALVRSVGGRIDAVYVCPHHPERGCACRKPNPGMLHNAGVDFGLDLANCVLIGDSLADLFAARAAGCQPIMVHTGIQKHRIAQLVAVDKSVFVMESLYQAVEWLLGRASVGSQLAGQPERNG